MSQDHRLQQQRFELKYLVDEAITPALRDFVSSYLELDDYGARRPDMSYPVYSVYLDSGGLETYQAAVNGVRNRFKLRLRYYSDDPDGPVFFEVKAREDNCILKQRCGVRREAVGLLVSGQLPEPKHLLSREPRHLVALQRFNLLQMQLNARPKAHNQYLREAWVSPGVNSVRVTMDRKIRLEPHFQAQPVTEMTRPVQVFPELNAARIEYAWSGNICLTRDFFPRAGKHNGLYYALGYGGHGVAMATWLGGQLANIMCGTPGENPFADLPFEPLPFYYGRDFMPLGAWYYRLLDMIS